MGKILIFGHKSPDTDTICSSLALETYCKNKGIDAEAVMLGKINDETKFVLDYLGINPPREIEVVEDGQEVILIDHNEFKQSVQNIEHAKIIAVVDHHCLGNCTTGEPLYYIAKPYGSTSTILCEEYERANMKIEKNEASLMLSAILSDTLLLKSPTTTQKDKQFADQLANIAGVKIEEYGLEMLKAGTNLDKFTEEELINIDAKNFEKNGVVFRIAQVNTVSIPEVLKRQQKLEEAIFQNISKHKLDLFVLAITDIINSNSQIIVLGKRADIVEKTCRLEKNTAFLEGIVSRKKQILPLIDKNI